MSAAATFKCATCDDVTLIKALFLDIDNTPICAKCYKTNVPQEVRNGDNLQPILEDHRARGN